MSLSDIFPTFAEAPYSYVVVPIILVSSVIGFYHKPYFHALLLHPYEVYRGKRLHTLLTSAFVHRNWIHLLFNTFLIYVLAYDTFGNIKQENGLWLALLFTPLFCLLLIVVPNVIQTLIKRNDFLFTAVGASGVTFGLYGFGFLFFPLQPITHMLFPLIENASHYWLYVFVVISLLSFFKQTKINKGLHVLAYLIGSFLALIIRSNAFFEFLLAFNLNP